MGRWILWISFLTELCLGQCVFEIARFEVDLAQAGVDLRKVEVFLFDFLVNFHRFVFALLIDEHVAHDKAGRRLGLFRIEGGCEFLRRLLQLLCVDVGSCAAQVLEEGRIIGKIGRSAVGDLGFVECVENLGSSAGVGEKRFEMLGRGRTDAVVI